MTQLYRENNLVFEYFIFDLYIRITRNLMNFKFNKNFVIF